MSVVWEEVMTAAVLLSPFAAMICWFTVSLILYCKTPKDSEKRRPRRTMLIISAVVTGSLIFAAVALVCMLLAAVAYM